MSELLVKLKEHRRKFTLADKQALILEYTPLIRYIAQRIAVKLPPNVDIDDLISSGVIGLMDAIDKYDPKRDNQFKTYAEFRIRGAILDELRSQDWVPRSIREKSKVLEKAYRRLEQKHGRKVSNKEVARELKMDLEEFQEMVTMTRSVSMVSIDEAQQFPFKDRRELIGLFEELKANNPHFYTTLKDIKKVVQQSLQELPESERMVLALYYYEDMNLKEIGSVLDVTESRVSQLHSQAIKRLQTKIKKVAEGI
ncbi:MAG: RNA polymerase subunit sigma [Deltaproteobacteria bacterium GWA2_38_16]|nr:MAG: RNA polymerase subunit sigma [Deltaproteobacteria bacterium GWA2_38_16]OGQ02481.1 MAG: RNA polymerase subunit sigma [Deltaproteobacteria bacterium RIFCSPHIGHO2_02_FULL_38_15]OGQ33227.1 MAG: RNA polymerase subunit sigma [Deltaproteobacteria bacterium RIFCSPLOWO2_01_FULL_38_9]HBQ21064.1 FliA/WhiG family RNA polymerase sigma factor [Deltaproteobacteria bacterium]